MKYSRNFRASSLFKLHIILVFTALLFSQPSYSQDVAKAEKYDTGKMWTFEFPPFEYLKEIYGFDATQKWFDQVRLSALRIPGCSASFVSSDGLIMTNNHCARGLRKLIQKDGEDLAKTAFFAQTLEDERKIPNYSAEQLVFMKDVTKEVQESINSGNDEKEKIAIRDKKIKELKAQYEKSENLKCDVITYYNGSLFFVQGFKEYKDVRLVFEPEEAIAYFGGDPDNFTFPRYNLDCTFMRIYDDNGNPLKTNNFFKWSAEGAKSNELVFTVGNPGSTNRLRTVAQLEYLRDITYRNSSFLADKFYAKLEELKALNPTQADEYEKVRLAFSNSQKSISNTYKALNDPYLLARKKDFEKKAREFVGANSDLSKQYGHVWKTIERTREELRNVEPKMAAFSVNPTYSSRYLMFASALVFQARQMMLPEDKRDTILNSKRYKESLKNLYPEKLDVVLEEAKLAINLDFIVMNLGKDNQTVKTLLNGKSTTEAAKYLIAKTVNKSKADLDAMFAKQASEILSHEDILIQYFAKNMDEVDKLRKQQKEIMDTENVTFGLLGQILYKMFGNTFSPDANRTLRISDGLMMGYDYNGTKAPVKTTFYGLFEKYFAFETQYPFNLSDRWLNLPKDFDLKTAFNFVATNDIVGGNSGSAMINKNAEVIGLAFDGNIESLQGNFIYLPTNNRCVGVDSKGMYEAIKKVYKADRLADELRTGKKVN